MKSPRPGCRRTRRHGRRGVDMVDRLPACHLPAPGAILRAGRNGHNDAKQFHAERDCRHAWGIRSDFNPPRKRMGIGAVPVKRVDQSTPLFSQADFGNFERARIDCWRLTHRATVGAGYAGSQPAPNTRPPPPRPLLGQAGGQNSTFLSPPKPPRKSTCFHANFHCASFCARHGPFQIDSNQRPKNALNR